MPPRTDSKEIILSDQKIRCVLVHDHVLLRQGLRRLLEDEPDIDVVGEAGNAAECLRKVHELRPDIVVADAGTFDLPAPEAELRVAQESPQTRVVFLSTREQTARVDGLRVATGDCAVLQTSAEELVEMVRNSCSAKRTNHDRTNHDPTNQWATSSACDPERLIEAPFRQERALTVREREVMKLLAEGKTVRAAAAVLGVSVKTVDAHKSNLMRKLGIHNKAALVMWAIQKQVVKVPVNF